MKLNSEISKYITKTFILSTCIVVFTFASIIFIGDLVEYNKKLSSYDNNNISLIVLLCSLNLPKMLQEVLPFCLLFSGMLWTIKINNNKELLIIRSSGLPVRKICYPIFLVSMILGFLSVTTLSPLISATQKKIQYIESERLGKPINSLLVTPSGFWVRQGSNEGKDIIYAKTLNSKNMTFSDVTVFKFNNNYEIQKRIKAKNSELFESFWLLKNTRTISNLGEIVSSDFIKLPTSITKSQIREGFSSPESLSLWSLIPFIKMFENAGFSAKKHRYHLYKLSTFPFLLASMSILGVSFNLNMFSRKKTNYNILIGIIFGFTIFYITKIINALAISGKMSLFFGTILPVLLPLLLGIFLIIHADEK